MDKMYHLMAEKNSNIIKKTATRGKSHQKKKSYTPSLLVLLFFVLSFFSSSLFFILRFLPTPFLFGFEAKNLRSNFFACLNSNPSIRSKKSRFAIFFFAHAQKKYFTSEDFNERCCFRNLLFRITNRNE